MSTYAINESTMTELADAIRLKCDENGENYTPAQMKEELLNLPYGKIPVYHYTEAARVIENILSFKKSHTDSLIFGSVSDSHVYDNNATYEALSKTSIRHAAFAMKTIGSIVGCDFLVNLGDSCWENGIDTDNAYAGSTYTFKAVQSAFSGIPSYNLVGNHDRTDDTEKLFSLIGKNNVFDDCGATQIRCFGYKDYSDKKVRVICLNSVDYLNASGGYGMSYEQKDFLMRSLDLSTKSDAADWQILILSHIPVDFNNGDYNVYADLQTIFNNYVAGTTAGITVNSAYALNEDPTKYATYSGGKLVYNYAGKNSAKIIANIHGHVHTNAYGRIATSNILRMSTPNSCFYLNKTESYPDYGDYSITTEEAAKLAKVQNTAKDTSVTFYCIDLDGQVIYAYGYGANTDRVASYKDAKTYSVTYSLTNVTSSNTSTIAVEYEAYNTILTEGADAEFSSVTVTMGGVDITSSVYADGVITISEVTGDIVITALAEMVLPYTNWFSADDPDFADAVRFSSSGGVSTGSAFVSGFIEVKAGDVVRVRCPNGSYADGTTGYNYRCICTYDSGKANIACYYPVDMTRDADGLGFRYTISNVNTAFIRVSGTPNGNWEGFVVTVNEPIE